MSAAQSHLAFAFLRSGQAEITPMSRNMSHDRPCYDIDTVDGPSVDEYIGRWIADRVKQRAARIVPLRPVDMLLHRFQQTL